MRPSFPGWLRAEQSRGFLTAVPEDLEGIASLPGRKDLAAQRTVIMSAGMPPV